MLVHVAQLLYELFSGTLFHPILWLNLLYSEELFEKHSIKSAYLFELKTGLIFSMCFIEVCILS